ncbi:MAG TPA: phosphodiesterase [Sediminispirochaeta sp.]|nr:phosphodiesterase [Sediminispirochaeta sp.]
MVENFTLAQISDLHIGRTISYPSGQVELFEELQKTVEKIARMEPLPDILMVTGDLANHASRRDYLRVKALLDSLPIPYYIVPGNHDSRRVLREVFSDHSYLHLADQFIQYSIDGLPVRILSLDTLAEGSHRGRIDEVRLRWLDERLAEEPKKPTLICMHHPPFRTGMPYPDSLGLDGTQEMAKIVGKYRNIEAIVSGHTHRESCVRWNGTVAYVTPSCTFSYKLEFHEVDDLDPLHEPPAFRLFRWVEGVGLVSHLCYNRDYEFGLSEGVPRTPNN